MGPLTIIVENISVKGPFTNKQGGQFFSQIIASKGKYFTYYTKTNQLAVNVGDKINISGDSKTYTTKEGKTGTQTIIKHLDVLEGASELSIDLPDEVSGGAGTLTGTHTPVPTAVAKKAATLGVTASTSKDLSMEVSGLLQAIITKHGLGTDTEELLRTSLRLKRAVASELEQTGTV